MITKILEIRYCIECPHCNGYFQCAKLERAVDEIPEDCPLESITYVDHGANSLDSKRLDFLEQQTRKSPTGVSLQWMPAGATHRESAGIHFMRRGKIYEQKKTVREAIDVAIKDCWK